MTQMARRPTPRPEDPKVAALRASGTLHPHPESIHDEAFSTEEFLDRRDRLQVKYEMLRRHRVERRPVTEVAVAFGASRQAFYTAARAFEAQGIAGLLPQPRGPKRAHKCSDEILDFVARWRAEQADPGETAAQVIERRFGIAIHPRSLDRALARRKKKLRGQGRAPT
jgi:transposase